MPSRYDKSTDSWRWSKWHEVDGVRVRKNGPRFKTKRESDTDEASFFKELEKQKRRPAGVPKFGEFFLKQFWEEWVIAEDNSPSEQESKTDIYENHLKEVFEKMPLDKVDVSEINKFKAAKLKAGFTKKTINNMLAVISKPLHYAHAIHLIDRVPRMGMYKIEQKEIEYYSFDEYVRILNAAKADDPRWYAAVCLAGEASLRRGELAEVRWREDIDMVAKTVTVNRQIRDGKVGPPKGKKRRTIKMTNRLHEALKAIPTVREGLVLYHEGTRKWSRTEPGTQYTGKMMENGLARICRLAGLPGSGWHKLRHTFATHAAMFGADPWSLMTWMGHKNLTQTMRYVHLVKNHERQIPEVVLQAQQGILDRDKMVLAMLSARGSAPVEHQEAPAKPAAPSKSRHLKSV